MNKVVKLQVPLPETIRKAAAERAQDDGFSSLQEAVRIFLKQYGEQQFNLLNTFPEESLQDYTNSKQILASLQASQRARRKPALNARRTR